MSLLCILFRLKYQEVEIKCTQYFLRQVTTFHFSVMERDWGARSTYISSAPQFLYPRPNWDPLHLLSRKRVCPPPGTKGVTQSPTGDGVGGSQFGRLEKKPIALCLLCAREHYRITDKILGANNVQDQTHLNQGNKDM
jgi:hypothetical protein